MNAEEVPVAQRIFGAGHYLRPSFVEPYRCKNVLIEGVTLRNAPMWVLHPTLSTNVTIRRVTIIGHGPNTDGADPESCRDVLIEECVFDTGDDCIALKSGRNQDGRRINTPVENVVIRGCRMNAGHGGITVGSEVSGGARNIFAEKNQLDSPTLERGLRLKTNTARGGFIENVYVRDIEIGTVQLAPIEIDLRYDASESGTFIPTVRNIEVERMRSQHSRHGVYIRGLQQPALHGVVCVFGDRALRGVQRGLDQLLPEQDALPRALAGQFFFAAPPDRLGKLLRLRDDLRAGRVGFAHGRVDALPGLFLDPLQPRGVVAA